MMCRSIVPSVPYVRHSNQSSSYTTLSSRVCKQLEVKRSKFIANAAAITDEKSALVFLSEVSDPRATHNCWAYKIREKYRFSDDGEPGGTAGRPIYTAIENSGLDGVMLVVTRYYGGTKLGTGGLVRAYGGIAADCLKDADTEVVKAKVQLVIKLRFDLLGVVYPLFQVYDVEKGEEYYEEATSVKMYLLVDEDRTQELESSLNNACRGDIVIERVQ